MKKLGVISFSKWQSYLFALVGLGLGIFYSLGGLIVDSLVSLGWLTTPETTGLGKGTILAFGALIGMPLIFATGGFLFGMIEALIYNFVCRFGASWLSFDSLYGRDDNKE